MAKYSARRRDGFGHRALSILPASPGALHAAERAGIEVIDAPGYERILRAIEQADIVQVHFWNSPEMYELLRTDLPKMRLMLRLNVGGEKAPQVLTEELIGFADLVAVGSPHTLELPVCREWEQSRGKGRFDLLIPAADFERLDPMTPRQHDGFNVGYIGTVDFSKMHPGFVRISAGVQVPGIRFVVCGSGGAVEALRRQAARYGIADRFELRGYVEDIRSVLEELDVFGYPLCEDNYSTSESVLHEAMFAGVPPVVFDHGGAPHTVEHGHTGLVVNSETEYQEAIHWLFRHPERRASMAAAARYAAREHFGAENCVCTLHALYRRMLEQPRQSRKWARGLPESGAERFVESLGDSGEAFRSSLFSPDLHAQLAADERIAASSPVLTSAGAGGILHYRRHYGQDAHLQLWSGLVLEQRGQNIRALAEYRGAITLGLSEPRVFWYLARVGAKLGSGALVVESLRRVLHDRPHFEPAGQMLEAWEPQARD